MAVACKGASHTYRDTLTVAVIVGQSPASGGPPLQSVVGSQFTVVVSKAAWRAEFPPALGTTFTSDDFGKLTVQQANVCGLAWHCLCVQNQRTRTS